MFNDKSKDGQKAEQFSLVVGQLPKREKEFERKRVCVFNPLKFKMMLCKEHKMRKACPRGDECQFAHGSDELRNPKVSVEDYLEELHERLPKVLFYIPKQKRIEGEYSIPI